jgi:hypothetical protein
MLHKQRTMQLNSVSTSVNNKLDRLGEFLMLLFIAFILGFFTMQFLRLLF